MKCDDSVAGICSSLLAVIEQLRERQAEESAKLSLGKSHRKRKKVTRSEKASISIEVLDYFGISLNKKSITPIMKNILKMLLLVVCLYTRRDLTAYNLPSL